MGHKNEGHKNKKKLTTKEKKAQNHAKLMELKGKKTTFAPVDQEEYKKAA